MLKYSSAENRQVTTVAASSWCATWHPYLYQGHFGAFAFHSEAHHSQGADENILGKPERGQTLTHFTALAV